MTWTVIRHARVAMLYAAVQCMCSAAEPENALRAHPSAPTNKSTLTMRQPASLDASGGKVKSVEAASYRGMMQQPNSLRFRRVSSEDRLPFPKTSGPTLSEPNPFPPDESAKALEVPVENASAGTKKAAELVTRAVQLAGYASSHDDLTKVMRLCKEATDEDAESTQTEFAVRLAAWAVNRRGELAAAGGDEKAALADFQQAVAIDPDCWQAIHNRGVSHAVHGNHSAALADFNQAIELNPRFAGAYRNRGELRSEVGLVSAAIKDYSQAIRFAPEDDELLRIRGHARHRLGHYVAAVQDLNETIRLNPNNAAAFTDRGNIYAELGYYRQALMDYHEALRLNPEYAPAYRSTAWVLATCPDARYRRPEKALVAARRGVAYARTVDPLAFDALAAAQASAGQFQEAAAHETRAIELAGEQPVSAGFRARLALYRKGKSFRATPRDMNDPPGEIPVALDERQRVGVGARTGPAANTNRLDPRAGSTRFPASRSQPIRSNRSRRVGGTP